MHADLRKVYRKNARHTSSDRPYTRLVASIDDVVVGMATCETNGDVLFFGSLGVLRNYRGRGVARALLGHLEEMAARCGARILECRTVEETGNAGFFQRLGFVVASRFISNDFESPEGLPVHGLRMVKHVGTRGTVPR